MEIADNDKKQNSENFFKKLEFVKEHLIDIDLHVSKKYGSAKFRKSCFVLSQNIFQNEKNKLLNRQSICFCLNKLKSM